MPLLNRRLKPAAAGALAFKLNRFKPGNAPKNSLDVLQYLS
jgi:hypothetical protein